MTNITKKIILAVLVLFSVNMQYATAGYIMQPDTVFDISEIEHIQGETIYGTLADFPHTFSFSVTQDISFSMQAYMDAKSTVNDVSLILIKQEKRGVSEVGRVTGKDTVWSDIYDIWNAITFTQSEKKTYMLTPGMYRMEVSAPENNRSYRVILGEGKSSFLKEPFLARKIFSGSMWSIFMTPLAVIVLIVVILLFRAFIYLRK